MSAVAWAIANWRLVLVGLAIAGSLGLYGAYAVASSRLADERDRVASLEVQLSGAREALERERAATLAAEQAAADWTAEAADRAADLQQAITEGKKADEAYAQCMDYRWPDGVIDRLPE